MAAEAIGEEAGVAEALAGAVEVPVEVEPADHGNDSPKITARR